MSGKFLNIAITLPDRSVNEPQTIMGLLDHGFDRVHIRKPSWSSDRVRELLEQIRPEYYLRISLHGTPEIVGSSTGQFPVGFQINRRFPEAPDGASMVSKSCHTIAEAIEASRDPRISYQTLSPIFNSISKKGYHSKFSPKDLEGLPPRTVALGGVTPSHFGQLEELGLGGVAMLGYIWNHLDEFL